MDFHSIVILTYYIIYMDTLPEYMPSINIDSGDILGHRIFNRTLALIAIAGLGLLSTACGGGGTGSGVIINYKGPDHSVTVFENRQHPCNVDHTVIADFPRISHSNQRRYYNIKIVLGPQNYCTGINYHTHTYTP
jgi:hypothetical protein